MVSPFTLTVGLISVERFDRNRGEEKGVGNCDPWRERGVGWGGGGR